MTWEPATHVARLERDYMSFVIVLILAVALFWVVCGVATYGLTLHDFTREYPYMENATFSRRFACGGPFTLIAALISAKHYGFRFRALTIDERFANFGRIFPNWYSRDRFIQEYGRAR